MASTCHSVADDPLSPYFLHHSDSPGLSLVSQSLTGDNYASLNRAMLIALSVKNKLGFIDGSISKPDGTDPNLLISWTRNNNIVIQWLLNSVTKEISGSIMFSDCAFYIWNDLRDRFQQSNGPRIFELRREFLNLSQSQTLIAAYFTKLKSLWDELNNFRPSCSCGKCTCGGVKDLASFHHNEYAMTFLLGLNDLFASVRGQLLLMDPLPPINKIFSLVVQEEHQRSVSNQSGSLFELSSAMSLATTAAPSKPPYNIAGVNGKKKPRQKDHLFCTKCQINGHTIDTCYQIHGYPPGYKPKPRSYYTSQSGSSTSSIANANQVTDQVDIGSMPPSRTFFQTLSIDQYQQLMSMFQSHLASSLPASHIDGNSSSHTTRTCFYVVLP